MLVIGLMSGTSADGIDAALVEWPADEHVTPFSLLAHAEISFPSSLQERIHALAAADYSGKSELPDYIALDSELGVLFADAAVAAAEQAGVSLEAVDCIASHGQTVGHYPERAETMQIGDAAIIAKRTGCTTVSDFRTRDMALGGQGAPLAPFFHWAAFGSGDENRIVLNLGGIANVTWLPKSHDPDDAVAFDTGPANSLIDGAMSILTDGQERMDRDGALARAGRVDPELLSAMLDDDYLAATPPKSTGRERYGTDAAQRWVDAARDTGCELNDLIATLVAFTATSVANACVDLLPNQDVSAKKIDRLIVGGGGASNPALMDALVAALPDVEVERFADHGVPVQAAEAMAFSLMGRNTLLGIPNHLPRCTGAREAGVLGVVTPASRA